VIVAAVVAAASGLLGAGLTAFVMRRRSEQAHVAPDDAAASSTSAPRWSDVVDRLSLGVVVSGPSGEVHYRNLTARSLEGTTMGVLVDDTVERLLATARGGEEVVRPLELYGPPRGPTSWPTSATS
jgi:hypothetical protein